MSMADFGFMFGSGDKADRLLSANARMTRARAHLGAALVEAGAAQQEAEAALWKLAHPVLRYTAVVEETESAINLANQAIEEMAAEIAEAATGGSR